MKLVRSHPWECGFLLVYLVGLILAPLIIPGGLAAIQAWMWLIACALVLPVAIVYLAAKYVVRRILGLITKRGARCLTG